MSNALIARPRALDLTHETLPDDIHILILQSFDSPRTLLAYISASPAAASIFYQDKKQFLVSLFNNCLSLQAVKTGVQIHHYKNTRYLATNAELGALSRTVTDNYFDLTLDQLEALWQLCLYHEHFVEDAMGQPWLRDRTSEVLEEQMSVVLRDRSETRKSYKHVAARLERPCKGGLPLQARLYSGFFLLELWMLLDFGSFTSRPSPWVENRVAENLSAFSIVHSPNLPRSREARISLFAETDLMVDMSLVMMYMGHLYLNQDRLGLDESFEFEPGHDFLVRPPMEGHRRVRELLIICNRHRPSSSRTLDWDFQFSSDGTQGHSMESRSIWAYIAINHIQRIWNQFIDPYWPTPYTWEIGHRPPPNEELE